MPGFRFPGPIGATDCMLALDEGTLARVATPPPVTIGTVDANAGSATTAAATDPEIEALDLRGDAKKGAYELKKAHPSVRFTSGRRTKAEQASAMASNVVENRKWIEETYASTRVSKACQKWVDDNEDKTSQDEIAEGLLSVLEGYTNEQLAVLSKHISGDAFDVQPVETDAAAIKATIRGLDGLDRFLEREGGLVRWHAQF
jgi:hypothetical protein